MNKVHKATLKDGVIYIDGQLPLAEVPLGFTKKIREELDRHGVVYYKDGAVLDANNIYELGIQDEKASFKDMRVDELETRVKILEKILELMFQKPVPFAISLCWYQEEAERRVNKDILQIGDEK